jgi:hypothetical protein
MRGTGFADGTYNVAYYDGGASGGQKVATDSNITVSGGTLDSQIVLTSYPSATAGTWHALVQPTGGTAFPSDYNTAVASPDTYQLVGNDSFTVQAGALPELPTVMAAMGAVGSCFAIYWWMRRRRVHRVR